MLRSICMEYYKIELAVVDKTLKYFIGGYRAIAQDMFAIDSKKPIYRSKKGLLAAGITAAGAGVAVAIVDQKRRRSEDNKQ